MYTDVISSDMTIYSISYFKRANFDQYFIKLMSSNLYNAGRFTLFSSIDIDSNMHCLLIIIIIILENIDVIL